MGLESASMEFPAILGDHPPVRKKVTLAADASARSKGTVLGVVTSSGHYAPYLNTNNDGTETAKTVLLEDVDAHAGSTAEAVVLVHGDANESALTGIDANGKADLLSVGIYVK